MATIFISVASYRDEDCKNTVSNMLDMAQYPHNLRFGVVEQNHSDYRATERCEPRSDLAERFSNNIRRIHLDHAEAAGPCVARYLASTLYDGETYFLQIDSHMRFVKNFDTKLVNMHEAIVKQKANEKIVLSTYTRSVDDHMLGASSQTEVPQICQYFWNKDDMLSMHGAAFVTIDVSNVKPVPFIAGGFLFVKGEPFLRDVPFDPHLKDVFVGEEILHAARIWTSGYDIYPLTENIAYHEFERKGKPKFWDNPRRDDAKAMQRVRRILKLEEDGRGVDDRYGLGRARTLDEFFAFAGVDVKNRTVLKNFCGDALLPPRIGFELAVAGPSSIRSLGLSCSMFSVAVVCFILIWYRLRRL